MDASGRLRGHALCTVCGYDLFSLRDGEQCPECGVPVGLSIHGDHLQYCRPQWVRRVGQAARVNAMLMMGLPVALVAAVLLRYAAASVLGVALLAWSISSVWATWQEEALPRQARGQRSAQVSAIALGLLALLILVSGLLGTAAPMAANVCILTLSFAVALVCYARWLAGLALRAPSAELWESLRARAGYVAALSLVLLGMTLGWSCFAAMLLIFVAPAWVTCAWLLGHSCLQAGELLLFESRRASENFIFYGAMLEKEQRWRGGRMS